MSKNRIRYGFTLNFPEAFTIKHLTQRGCHPQYITARKRVERAVALGEVREVGKFKVGMGRPQTIYVRSNITNVSLAVASLAKTGEVRMTEVGA